MKERLQKLLAQANIGSRRASEDLITKGRVRVNGATAQLGDKADPATDVIEVDGGRLKFASQSDHIYIMLNKPKQVLTTDKPHRGDRRETVAGLIGRDEHLFSIGRLDADSEGLVVMTNDGDLSQKLSHPRYRHSKTYKVEVLGLPSAETLERWQEGIFLDDGKTAPCLVDITKGSVRGTTLRVIMTEGKKRQIRRVAAALGHPVQRLIRTHIGLLALGDLEPGQSRPLTAKEVVALSTPAPEIKTLRVKQHRSSADKAAAPAPEGVQEKRPSRRITLPSAADETVEKRRPTRRGVEVTSYEEGAKRRAPRPKSAEDEAPEKRRSPRVRPDFSDDKEAPKRRTPRTKPAASAAKNVGKRRVPRPTSAEAGDVPETRSAATEETPKKRIPRMRRPIGMGKPTPRIREADEEAPKRRTSRVKPTSSSDQAPDKRRSSRTKPSAASTTNEEKPAKRRTSRVKPSAAPDAEASKSRKPRRKNDAHDDKWGKPSPSSRKRKPRSRKDSPR